jgi:hypothetical protein
MSDIVERLRAWDHCWPARWLEDAVPEAAAEIERLRAALWKVQVSTEAGSTANVIAAAALTQEKPND